MDLVKELEKEYALDEAKKRAKQKKYPYSSKTYTTGDQNFNIKQFNKRMGSDFDEMPNRLYNSVEQAQKEATKAATEVGTIAAQSPDGANSIAINNESTTADNFGEMAEDFVFFKKAQHDIELPSTITLINKQKINDIVMGMKTGDKFTVGYITPIFITKEALSEFVILKASQFIGILEDQTTNKYADNSILCQYDDSEATKVKYYLDLLDGRGYNFILKKDIKNTILNKIKANPESKINIEEVETKLGKLFEISAPVSLDNTAQLSKYRQLLKDRIFYFKTKDNINLGTPITESLIKKLTEAKRYVRRYYIRPQDIFASNKNEILKALIDIGDQNCSVYTLNNLGDIKDVNKLTTDDIIYYYDDGILYDKNHIRIMDYNLAIKHEENRDKVNTKQISDRAFNQIYDDRMTDKTIVEEFPGFKDNYDLSNFEKLKGAEVKTTSYGNGIITDIAIDGDNTVIEILFNDKSTKKFLLATVLRKNIMNFIDDNLEKLATEALAIEEKAIHTAKIQEPNIEEQTKTEKERAILNATDDFENNKVNNIKQTLSIFIKQAKDGYPLSNILRPTYEYYKQYHDTIIELKKEKITAETLEAKIDWSQKLANNYSDTEFKAWLKSNITKIMFILPTLNKISNAPKSLKRRLDITANYLEKAFPNILTDKDHFRYVDKNPEPDDKPGNYSFWGLVGEITFKVPYKDFPEKLKALISEATNKSINAGHNVRKFPNENDKTISNVYLCFAICELFNNDIDFYMTADDLKIENLENPFNLTFKNLQEDIDDNVCCICGEEITGYGNNAEPVKNGRCCDACNVKFVIPARVKSMNIEKPNE